jgi:hypothetical protein
MALRESYTDMLSVEERCLVFDSFIQKCKERERRDGNQIISYRIAIDMIDDICIDLGYAACPTCGHKGVKKDGIHSKLQ